MRKWVRIWIVCLLSLVLAFGGAVPAAAAEQTEQEAILCADPSEAAVALRGEMELRESPVAVSFPAESNDRQVLSDVLNEALIHTGVPTQGDYLRFHVRKCTGYFDAQEQDGLFQITLTYDFTYYSTREQEDQVDAAVTELLDSLDVYTAGDAEKFKAIYDYICETVCYDSWGAMLGETVIYSTYAALIKKLAVCQGYATLLYRLALELGLDARVIPGTGKGLSHGWNIVRLGEKYYNVDATWDAELVQNQKPYAYYLRCDANFTEHTRKSTYTTEEFCRAYPMADTDYSDIPEPLDGDLLQDGKVNEDDVIYLLQHVLAPDIFPVDQPVDYTKDGRVDEEDAVYLLKFLLQPQEFPL